MGALEALRTRTDAWVGGHVCSDDETDGGVSDEILDGPEVR